jgi:hypothetical protein
MSARILKEQLWTFSGCKGLRCPVGKVYAATEGFDGREGPRPAIDTEGVPRVNLSMRGKWPERIDVIYNMPIPPTVEVQSRILPSWRWRKRAEMCPLAIPLARPDKRAAVPADDKECAVWVKPSGRHPARAWARR